MKNRVTMNLVDMVVNKREGSFEKDVGLSTEGGEEEAGAQAAGVIALSCGKGEGVIGRGVKCSTYTWVFLALKVEHSTVCVKWRKTGGGKVYRRL